MNDRLFQAPRFQLPASNDMP